MTGSPCGYIGVDVRSDWSPHVNRRHAGAAPGVCLRIKAGMAFNAAAARYGENAELYDLSCHGASVELEWQSGYSGRQFPMSTDGEPSGANPPLGTTANERREALIKLGKYAAYATPLVIASVSAVHGAPVSGPQPPSPPPPAESDIRLKRDIAPLGRLDNGIGLYRYRYLWSDTLYVGVMAQEVARIVPHAVLVERDGYLRVDYEQLRMRLLTWDEWLEGADKNTWPMAA